MTFNPNMPYNDLPLLPPGKDLETKAVLKKTIAAAKALAQLKGVANSIPNPEILINSITLQEAKSSSEIENIVTTNKDISTRKTAGRYLKELVRLNILKPEKVGKEVIYLNTKLYNILSGK